MLQEKTEIGSGLLFCLLFPMIFGYGLSKLSALAAKTMGHNGYWGLVFSYLLAVLVMAVIVSLGKRFPELSLVELLPRFFGKPIGIVFGLIYTLFLLALIVWTVRAVADTYHVYFLVRTPANAVVAVFLLSSLYIAWKGIEGISRLAAFLFVLPLMFIILTIIFSFQGFRLDNIQPIFFFEGKKVLSGAFHLFNPFLPLASLFMIYRYFHRKKRGFKVLASAVGLASILLFFIVVVSIGVYGSRYVMELSWSFIELSKFSDIPYLLQTSGLFFASVFLIEAVISVSALIFAAADSCAHLVGPWNYKVFLLILLPFVYIGTNSLQNVQLAEKYFDIVRNAGFFITFVFPLAFWAYTTIFGKQVTANAP